MFSYLYTLEIPYNEKLEHRRPLCTERLFVRINRKSESYFSIISFQSVANRVYVSEINIVVFKRRN